MTRKDYAAIADELRKMSKMSQSYIHPDVVDALCAAFRKDNPKFKPDTFKAYLTK